MEPHLWLLLAAFGAWAAVDGVAAGQLMIGRPLVTGTLAGALLGDAPAGFLLGLLMEVAHLGVVPAGGARLPEPGPATIPGVVLAVGVGGAPGTALGLTLGIVLALAGAGGVVLQRRLNGRLVEGLELGTLPPERLGRRIAVALGFEAARGAAVVVAGMVLALPLRRWAAAGWPLADHATWALLLVLLSFPAGVLARGFPVVGGRAALLVGGGVAGVACGMWMWG